MQLSDAHIPERRLAIGRVDSHPGCVLIAADQDDPARTVWHIPADALLGALGDLLEVEVIAQRELPDVVAHEDSDGGTYLEAATGGRVGLTTDPAAVERRAYTMLALARRLRWEQERRVADPVYALGAILDQHTHSGTGQEVARQLLEDAQFQQFVAQFAQASAPPAPPASAPPAPAASTPPPAHAPVPATPPVRTPAALPVRLPGPDAVPPAAYEPAPVEAHAPHSLVPTSKY